METDSLPSLSSAHPNNVVSFAVRQKQWSGLDWSLEVISVYTMKTISYCQGVSPNYFWERRFKILGSFACLREGTKQGPVVLTVVQAPFSRQVTITSPTRAPIKLTLSKWRWMITDLPWPRIGGRFDFQGHQYSWNFKGTLLNGPDGEVVASVHDWHQKYGRLEIQQGRENMIELIVATFLMVWESVKGIHLGSKQL